LLPTPPAEITKGQIILDGEDIVPKTEKQMEKIRGNVVSMIFQDPMTSLNPTMRVGRQIDELIMKNEKVSRQEAKRRAIELLDMVGIPNAASRYNQYPHQFSGGMRQRVMIAIAVAARPKLLIADEPTTALDVTIQAQILELMKRLKEKLETSIIFITHDLGVVANMADRVAVMYAGQIVEIGTSDEIFYDPRHPYTWGLLSSIPSLDANDGEELHAIPGSPPDLTKPPVGDAFARRSPYALQIDFEKEPPMFQVSETHFVKSWLLHPNAPKVEPPKIVQQRRRVLPGTFEHPVLVEGGL